ncbi:MAG: hypothetical protein H7Y20_05505 [Bryobacteraceae bacterium]|nr:hypothetical protein [Bryobacteraceae bacterium]
MNKNISISFVLAAGMLLTTACSRKQSEIGQNGSGEVTPETSATVTMTDGSKYRGLLVSKNGSQMTFRGDNGATRTLDSRDIRSIRLDGTAAPGTGSDGSSRSAGSYGTGKPLSTPQAAKASVQSQSIISSGTQIQVRNNDAINSGTASAGQTFSAVVASDVVGANGEVAIPRGSDATLVVRRAGAGKVRANELGLALSSITLRGVSHDVQTEMLLRKGRDGVGANKRTALFSGGGAAVGALIGGLAGGGKGAVIGAASGAGAGAGTQILTRGSVKIPSESLMSFRLQTALAL